MAAPAAALDPGTRLVEGVKNDHADIGLGKPLRWRERARNRRTAVGRHLSVRAGHAVPGVRGRSRPRQLVRLQGPEGETSGEEGAGGRKLLVRAPAPGPDLVREHHAG